MGIAGPSLCLITPQHDGANPTCPGQGIRLSATVTSLGSPFTPNTMALTLRDPEGALTSYTPMLDGVGSYHQDIALPGAAATGVWTIEWQSTHNGGGGSANNYAVGIDSFSVTPLPF